MRKCVIGTVLIGLLVSAYLIAPDNILSEPIVTEVFWPCIQISFVLTVIIVPIHLIILYVLTKKEKKEKIMFKAVAALMGWRTDTVCPECGCDLTKYYI